MFSSALSYWGRSVFVYSIFLLCFFSGAEAFGIEVPAGGVSSCFFREIHASSRVTVHYSARETVIVNVKSPTGTVLHSNETALNGEHTFTSEEDGPYEICVSMDAQRRLPTVAKFRFLVLNEDELNPDIADKHQVTKVERMCHKVEFLAQRALYDTHLYSDTAVETDETLRRSTALAGRLAALEFVAALIVSLSQITHFRRMLVVTRSKLQRMV